MVSLHNGTIQTDLYTKQTDKHQHLLSSSCHPQHTKTSIPFSLALRIRRICSTNPTFQLRINELKAYLLLEDIITSFLTHNSYDLLIFLALTLCKLTVTTLLTAYLLSLHITQHFLTSLIYYANILTYYFPPTVAGTFLNTHLSSLTDALPTFTTF